MKESKKVTRESKISKKLHEKKAKIKEDRGVLRVILGVIRWVATVVIMYAFTAAMIVSVIPFTTSYLAGAAQISKDTDIISGLAMWGFPSLAATLIITVLVVFVDVKIFRFFKKWLSVDGMKQNAENLQSKADNITKSK